MNEADVAKVVRHLVDEPRLAGAVNSGIGKVFFAELAEHLRLEIGENRRIRRIVGIGVAAL